MEILLIGIDPSPYDYQHQRSIPWNLDLQRRRRPDFFDDGGPLGSACLAPADQRAAFAGLSVSGGKKCVKSSDIWLGTSQRYAEETSEQVVYGCIGTLMTAHLPIFSGGETHWG